MKTVATPSHTPTDSEVFARLETSDGRDLAALRRNIVKSFSKDDLHETLFDLGLCADAFGDRVSTIARLLITNPVQTNRLDELIRLCQVRRPRVEW